MGKQFYRIEESRRAENTFVSFCEKNSIFFQKLDDRDDNVLRIKYLKNSKGKCPDFLITKNSFSCFVEVKTLTNLTNAKNEKEMDMRREFLSRDGKSGIISSGVGDVIAELKGPFRTFVQSASDKFENINNEYKYPRLLILNGLMIDCFSMHALFHGSYLSYKRVDEELQCVGFQKTKVGLFDRTGSNISAVIYWDREQKRYCGLENIKAIVKFSENDFHKFFS